MQPVADRVSNPFDLSPPCERFVPGYGDTSADFHVVGTHPGSHGGLAAGVPFTGKPWSERFFGALEAGGLVEAYRADPVELTLPNTFLSYIHACAPEGTPPTADAYRALEPYFDAELRAITADVLLPVGRRATEHVFASYTARPAAQAVDLDHATEVRGSGWLVVPIRDPAAWEPGDAEALAAELRRIRSTDYRRIADLGRFLPDDQPYFVR